MTNEQTNKMMQKSTEEQEEDDEKNTKSQRINQGTTVEI